MKLYRSKTLDYCYAKHNSMIALIFTGKVEQAIKGLHVNFQVILRSFIFSLKSQNFAQIVP